MPVFDPKVLQAVVREAVGLPLDEMIVQIHESLLERYPGRIDPRPSWVLNQAAGSLGAFVCLHASLEEYVLIFGTPVGTQGHSGRFPADDWFIMLTGEQHVFAKGELQMRVFEPGDMNHMRRGEATGFRLTPGAWGMEYARGFIPGMLPFGLADTLFGNLDYREFLGLVRVYGKLTMRELAMRLPVGEGVRRLVGIDREARSQVEFLSLAHEDESRGRTRAAGLAERHLGSASAAQTLHR